MTTMDRGARTPAPLAHSAGAEAPPLDQDRLMGLVMQVVGELGGAVNAALAVIGDRLGYYRELLAQGPATPIELAERTGTDAHYARDWLGAQAAGGYLTYEPADGRFHLDAEQAALLAVPDSPVYVQGGFRMVVGAVQDTALVQRAARSGDGIATAEHSEDLRVGTGEFFGSIYRANLVGEWLPALDGVVDKLTAGASVADVGCGTGTSTLLMAQAFPRSSFLGLDITAASIATAREDAARRGLSDRVEFSTRPAGELPGSGYDLIAFCNCLHDMGDPVGAASRARSCVAEDGTVLIVEPAAGDTVQDNLTPIGRLGYCMSTLLCVPESLSQDCGVALGALAGPARIRDVMTTAGFGRFRVAAQSPFSTIYEARP